MSVRVLTDFVLSSFSASLNENIKDQYEKTGARQIGHNDFWYLRNHPYFWAETLFRGWWYSSIRFKDVIQISQPKIKVRFVVAPSALRRTSVPCYIKEFRPHHTKSPDCTNTITQPDNGLMFRTSVSRWKLLILSANKSSFVALKESGHVYVVTFPGFLCALLH